MNEQPDDLDSRTIPSPQESLPFVISGFKWSGNGFLYPPLSKLQENNNGVGLLRENSSESMKDHQNQQINNLKNMEQVQVKYA